MSINERITEVKANLEWAMNQANHEHHRIDVLFSEHWEGYMNAGGTITLCEDGDFNVDYDNRCDCCGWMGDLGSIDFTRSQTQEVAEKIANRLYRDEVRCDCDEF